MAMSLLVTPTPSRCCQRASYSGDFRWSPVASTKADERAIFLMVLNPKRMRARFRLEILWGIEK